MRLVKRSLEISLFLLSFTITYPATSARAGEIPLITFETIGTGGKLEPRLMQQLKHVMEARISALQDFAKHPIGSGWVVQVTITGYTTDDNHSLYLRWMRIALKPPGAEKRTALSDSIWLKDAQTAQRGVVAAEKIW